MRHPRIILASIGLAVVAAASGVTAASATGSPARSGPHASTARPALPGAAATVRTARVAVGGRTETILVSASGLPLYYYRPDTAATSRVTGQLAALWPPLISAAPAGTGLSGKLTAVRDGHGSQVAYNGHLLYTFTSDRAGRATGQGVENFFLATPGLAPASAASGPPAPAAPAAPAAPSGSGYGY